MDEEGLESSPYANVTNVKDDGLTMQQIAQLRYLGTQSQEVGFQDNSKDLFIVGRLSPECRCIRSLRNIRQFGYLRNLRLININKLHLAGLEEVSQSLESMWIENCSGRHQRPIDLSPLEKIQFKKLKKLGFKKNGISTLNIAGTIPALAQITIVEEDALVSLAFKSTFPKLSVVKMVKCKALYQIVGAAKCPYISTLIIRNCYKCHVPIDLNSNQLRSLDLSESGIPIIFVSYLSHVKEFQAAGAAYNDLCGIESMKELVKVECPHNCLFSIQNMSCLENIRYINLYDNKLYSLDGIGYMLRLEYLDVSGNELTSLDPLKTLRKVKHLDVSQNRVQSLESVTNMFELEYFSFENNRVASPKELAVLLNFPLLTYLGVIGNSVISKMDGKLALARAVNKQLKCILNDNDDKLFKEIIGLIGKAQYLPAKVVYSRRPRKNSSSTSDKSRTVGSKYEKELTTSYNLAPESYSYSLISKTSKYTSYSTIKLARPVHTIIIDNNLSSVPSRDTSVRSNSYTQPRSNNSFYTTTQTDGYQQQIISEISIPLVQGRNAPNLPALSSTEPTSNNGLDKNIYPQASPLDLKNKYLKEELESQKAQMLKYAEENKALTTKLEYTLKINEYLYLKADSLENESRTQANSVSINNVTSCAQQTSDCEELNTQHNMQQYIVSLKKQLLQLEETKDYEIEQLRELLTAEYLKNSEKKPSATQSCEKAQLEELTRQNYQYQQYVVELQNKISETTTLLDNEKKNSEKYLEELQNVRRYADSQRENAGDPNASQKSTVTDEDNPFDNIEDA